MSKIINKVTILFFVVMFFLTSITIYAQTGATNVKNDETFTKSWFGANQTITNDGIIKGDMFSAGQSISSNGTVEGDMVAAGMNISTNGTVNGDLISAGSEISAAGKILGNMRLAAGTITISGSADKNVNLFSGTTYIKNTSVIGSNLVAFAGDINIEGKVKGNARIEAGKITLNGEFFGDVDINQSDSSNDKSQVKLVVLPGAIVHGKLTYKGLQQADIRDGAKISSYEWIKPEIKERTSSVVSKTTENIWRLIRLLFTTLVYFLVAMMLYKMFPAVFIQQGEIIRQKPLNVFGVGLIGMASILLSIIIFVILLILSIILSPSIGLVFGAIALLGYIILFYFSTIPISLWLGNLIFKDKFNLPYRFGAGLALFTFGLFAINLLAQLPTVGALFLLIAFVIAFLAVVYGVGALLYGLRYALTAINKVQDI